MTDLTPETTVYRAGRGKAGPGSYHRDPECFQLADARSVVETKYGTLPETLSPCRYCVLDDPPRNDRQDHSAYAALRAAAATPEDGGSA